MDLRFKAPAFAFPAKRQTELPFTGNVAAGAWLTLISGRIGYPFRVVQAKMIFADEANNQIEHRWFVSRSTSLPTTGFPTDGPLFARESPTAGFIGKALIRVAHTNVEFRETGLYIRLGTYNTSPYAYDINCSIIIEEV